MATDDLKVSDSNALIGPSGLSIHEVLAAKGARIEALEAQLAARDARLANIAALARKHQAVCGSDGNWAAVEGFATIGKENTWAA